AVVEATQQFYSLSAGNVHRSQFAEAQRLTARYEAAREKVAQLMKESDEASKKRLDMLNEELSDKERQYSELE
ncbi:aminotransferase class V-fold PLP-dependent enzyme, partial [Escherichia coli]|uniref:aminotransferase class V-fold PLP-dependent enzyme n=1 Tax=Escherichia coli TaxID=562 RepID=UPI002813600E